MAVRADGGRHGASEEVTMGDFPEGFVFGVATSAYQVEGGRRESGKGDSIWDVFSETEGKILDGSNGDVAVDQYHRYKAKQGGEIGLVVDCEWAEAFSDSTQDKVAAQRHLEFQLGWYLDPIFYGDYPKSMCERLGNHLPRFSDRDKEFLHHSVDFVGLNHYTSRFIAHTSKKEDDHFYQVQQIERIVNWPGGEAIGQRAASKWLYVVPWGIRKVLNYIAERYENPIIYVTENGVDEEEEEFSSLDRVLDDTMRVDYFKGYLAGVAQSLRDGVDVRGYFAWSFLDNFEWAQGYTKRFGLVYVDYKNGLSRHPKSSAIWFSQFLKGDEGEKE